MGDLLSPATGVVTNLIGSVDDLLNGLTTDVLKLLSSLTQILNIPKGVNPLTFVQNLITQLEQIINQLLNKADGSGLPFSELVNDAEEIANGLAGDSTQIVDQLIELLHIPKSVNVENFIQHLIGQLEQLLQVILTAISRILNQLLDVTDQLKLNGIINDLKVVGLIQKLIFTLRLLLVVLQVANATGGL